MASRHAAVVGKPERPTPEITSKVIEINFNPYWYVPRTIIHKDLIPKGRAFAARGQDMLAVYRMQAFDAAGNPLDPGRSIGTGRRSTTTISASFLRARIHSVS